VSKITFLSFEQSIAELDSKIEELRFVQDDSAVDISEEIDRLAQKKPAADQRHLRQAHALAGVADCASSAAALHHGLRQRNLHRFP